jgi:hypothetical protein
MEDFEKNDETREGDGKFKEEIFSKAVRAGKRTYFFDVKSTKRDEYYLTITESKKRFELDGNFHFEKHKIFLYQEDFKNFLDGLNEVVDFIDQRQEIPDYQEFERISIEKSEPVINEIPVKELIEKDFTDISFDDLTN